MMVYEQPELKVIVLSGSEDVITMSGGGNGGPGGSGDPAGQPDGPAPMGA